MTEDLGARGSDTSKILATWLTFAGILITAGISGYNVWQTSQIQQRQAELSDKQITNGFLIDSIKNDLTKRDQDLGRLRFVKELLLDAMSSDVAKRATFLTLVQLTLTEAEYRVLVAALSASSDPKLKEVGESGQQSIAENDQKTANEITNLVAAIESDDKATRLSAMDSLYSRYVGDPRLTSLLIDYLASATSKALHIQGRINALFLLTNISSEGWRPDLVASAKAAVDTMEAAGRGTIGPAIGSQTEDAIRRVRSRLASLTSGE